MRTIPAAALILLALAAKAGANEKEAKAILDRAIQAHGGAEALTKAQRSKRTDTGTQAILNRDVPFVSQVTRDLPDRVRLHIELDKKVSSTLVLDGNRAWQSEAGAPSQPLPPARLGELREEVYVWYLATLVPLTNPKLGVTLSSIGKALIDGEEAVGVLVRRRGYADAKLYFLTRNGLLAKVERKVREGGRDVEKEYLYGGYKKVEGVTLPTKETVKVNRDKFTEFTISEYAFPEKLGAGTFARP